MIHIFYRHTNSTKVGSYRPSWFDYEKCFLNLLDSISLYQDVVTLNLVFDGDISKNNIYSLKSLYNTFIIEAGSDLISWKKTTDIIKSQCEKNLIKDDDLIYYLENDYLHVKNWVPKVLEFFKIQNDNYVSLYDHADKYFNYNSLKCKIIVSCNHHWRTVPSTCGSYIITKKVFQEDLNTIELIDDFVYRMVDTPDHFKFLILNSYKKREVFSPVPGLSTHVMNGLMSPTIDWETLNNSVNYSLNSEK